MKYLLRGYNLKIYPTEQQKCTFQKYFNGVNFVYNWGLEQRIKHYQETQKTLSLYETQKLLTLLKKEKGTAWLNEVNAQSLTFALQRVDNGFRNFFRRVKKGDKELGFPKFKSSKITEQSFYSQQGNSLNLNQKNKIIVYRHKKGGKHLNFLNIMNVKNIAVCISSVKYKEELEKGIVKGVTITRQKDGKFFASLCVNIPCAALPRIDKAKKSSIKIDLNTCNPYVAFSKNLGLPINHWDFLNVDLQKIKRLDRKLPRQKQGSVRREETRKKLARLHCKIANRRKSFLNNISKKIVENYKKIVINDMYIAGSLLPKQRKKTRDFNRTLLDKGMGEFKRQLVYKAAWYKRKIILV